MPARNYHVQHSGEKYVQRKRGVPPTVPSFLAQIMSSDMPEEHSLFFSQLMYFCIATLDSRRRPWASLIVMPRLGSIAVRSPNQLSISGILPLGDPFVTSLKSTKSPNLFAGLGIDFGNRRRNKVAGIIDSAQVQSGSSHRVELSLTTTENLGNCPKYITVRKLQRHDGPSEVLADRFAADGAVLDAHALALVERASTAFLATRHSAARPGESEMGLNHRGGRPGFIRAYAADGGTCLVLPDYSGNRFYQSLGNVQSDGAAALLVPDFATGDVLHVTGAAENLFDADAAALMPRAALVTRLRVAAYVLVHGGLGVRSAGPEEPSPYSPPVRLLASELRAAADADATAGGAAAAAASSECDAAGAAAEAEGAAAEATLVGVRPLTGSVSAFTFRLGRPVRHLPGGHVILDFSRAAPPRPYAHMSDARPLALNDDLVRAWTITSPPPFDAAAGAFAATDTVTVAVRRVPGGAVSPLLHAARPGPGAPALRLVGAGGGFSCFDWEGRVADAAMVWIAGGVGLTPFLAMHAALAAVRRPADVVLLYAGRGDDEALLAPILLDGGAGGPSVRVVMFDSTRPAAAAAAAGPGRPALERRRMGESDVRAVPGVAGRAAYLCGPAGLMSAAGEWLRRAGVDPARIHRESFAF